MIRWVSPDCLMMREAHSGGPAEVIYKTRNHPLKVAMEAEAGIEPANVGFANRCLTTWPLRLDETSSCAAKMLPQSGLVVVAIPSIVNCTIVELLFYGVTCQRIIF